METPRTLACLDRDKCEIWMPLHIGDGRRLRQAGVIANNLAIDPAVAFEIIELVDELGDLNPSGDWLPGAATGARLASRGTTFQHAIVNDTLENLFDDLPHVTHFTVQRYARWRHPNGPEHVVVRFNESADSELAAIDISPLPTTVSAFAVGEFPPESQPLARALRWAGQLGLPFQDLPACLLDLHVIAQVLRVDQVTLR